jgi:hypothetical protein
MASKIIIIVLLLLSGCAGFRVGTAVLIEYGDVSNTSININDNDKDKNEIENTNISAAVSPNSGW